MPYNIKKEKGGKFKVVNAVTKKVHAKGTTLAKAEAQVRLLHMIDAAAAAKGKTKYPF